ncbi:MAG: ribosomal protein S18-alanine N-acetyltransferase [Gemmatimonadaceae bacterium]|nr:ribosomal protein S18-alanine N-acetyltransferase [Gemmatimonadaceae bacterium]
MTVIVRPAIDADIESVALIEQSSFSDPWPRPGFEPLVRAPRCMFIVAEEAPSEGVAGYSVARWVEDEAELLNIAVADEQRGKGIGGVMLDHVVRGLEERGIRHIFLEVRDSNTAARELYRSRGFRELSRRAGYYQRPTEDAIVLAWRRGG